MKKTYIEDIRERDPINSVFLVRDKNMAMAKNGKPYMNLKLMDRSGEVDGRIWDNVDELTTRFDKDDFVHIKGKANLFMGKMQFIINSIERVDERQVNLVGGLLEHSLCVARLARDVSERYPRINRDLLVCSALLHDIGKVAELRYARSFDYTDTGKLIGHIVMGVEMLEEKIRTCPDFPAQKTMLLKHMLLSHHGQYEYGSPKRPKTLEAVVLNFVDDMDAKINGIALHIDREQHNPSAWTSYHRLYDRYFYAPADEAETETIPAPPSEPATEAPEPASSLREHKNFTDKKQTKRNNRYQEPLRTSLGDQLAGSNLDLFEPREDGER
ncbi:MAG: HD domain-containing protein [Geobacteraceae bacterium]|nr:HD domain-containing protein [Geobacteraceae bacterium]